MAGVGFELKKLFKKRGGYFSILKGYSVSAIVTEGPMILCMVMLFAIRQILKYCGASYGEQEMYLITTTYIMIFSLIFSNTVLMFVSRFTSNCIYEKRAEDILPSFYAIVFWTVLFSGIISGVYMVAFLEKPLLHKFVNWIQFMTMLIVWIEMSYLSAIKKYVRVLIGFITAAIISIVLTIILVLLKLNPLFSAFVGSCAGFAVMAVMYLSEMIRYFPKGKTNIFIFFPALDKYKDLIATGFFTALGLYGHNFVFWFSDYRVRVVRGMVYCMKYDIASFFASLTIIPFLVIFVVSLEVSFYEKYKRYFDTILYDGTYEDIMFEDAALKKTLFRELSHVFEIQFFIEIVCITFLGNFLSTIGFDREMMIIFRYLCMGYCFYVLVKSIIIILMYFDERKGAFFVSFSFALLSIVLSVLTMQADVELYGLGFAGAAVISSLYGLWLLYRYINKLEFHVFCSQPLFSTDEEGFFTRLGGYFNAKVRK